MRKIFGFLLILLLVRNAEAELGKLKQSTPTTVNILLVNATTQVGITGATIGSISGFIRKHSDTTSTTVTAITFSGSELGLGAYNINLTAAHTDTLRDLTLCYTYAGAATFCDTYKVTGAEDPELLADFASIPDLLAEPCADMNVLGSWGKRLCDNLDVSVGGVPNALLDLTDGVEVGLTVRKHFRAVMAVMANKSSGYNTNTPTYRDFNDSKNRITSTTNNTGRTSVTFDLD